MMVQSGEFMGDLIQGVEEALLETSRSTKKGVKETVNDTVKGIVKSAPLIAKSVALYYAIKKLNEFNKKFTASEGLGITLANNEIKDIIKFIRYLENREILLKRTARKINSQEEVLLNFLAPLTRVALPLMKNVFRSLAKSVLVPLGLVIAVSATDAAVQKKILGSGQD